MFLATERRAASASLSASSSSPHCLVVPLALWLAGRQGTKRLGIFCYPHALLQGPLGGTRHLLFGCPRFKAGGISPLGS